jgi:hypothetical protein
MKKRAIAIRNRRESALSHARIRRKLWPDRREDGIGGVSGTTFEITATEVTLGFHVAITGSMAERRRSSRLMTPKTPRFCPEMKTRRGFCVS